MSHVKVRVKFIGEMRKKFSIEDLWISFQSVPTIKDVLAELERERGVKVNLGDSSVAILVNGRRIEFIGGLNAKLKHMDEIVIMPAIAGGSKIIRKMRKVYLL
ncbi:MoaD/ThiS family protein [Candidatus Bathyarchaeota archaeon]|nr:MoaD/ThiS family protein [Candidatus Bathyarchaeota archaeon]